MAHSPNCEDPDRVVDEVEHLTKVEADLQQAAGGRVQLALGEPVYAAGIISAKVCAAVAGVARGSSELRPIRVVEELLLDDLCQGEVDERPALTTSPFRTPGVRQLFIKTNKHEVEELRHKRDFTLRALMSRRLPHACNRSAPIAVRALLILTCGPLAPGKMFESHAVIHTGVVLILHRILAFQQASQDAQAGRKWVWRRQERLACPQ